MMAIKLSYLSTDKKNFIKKTQTLQKVKVIQNDKKYNKFNIKIICQIKRFKK